jgi:peptide/nickel transport system substrate-binding protein
LKKIALKRRNFIASSAATLAMPAVGHAQSAQVFKWIPSVDVSVLDPIWTTTYPTRHHAYLVFDTLYGQTGPRGGYAATPQMVEGHTVADDGKTWKLTLRDGLMFHDGTKVLARDCVASIRRWGARDVMGQTLMARTDDLSAPDDKTIVFRLSKPFPLLPDALGKITPSNCVIMPERLASTDPFKKVTEMVGSGPYRYKADERVPGALLAYERFAGYVPRAGGDADWTSGPKVAHFDRIEWHIIPDPATAAAAMRSGEMDGWEFPSSDLLPQLERERHLRRELIHETGFAVWFRPNHLQPPFDNPAIRRALLAAIDQESTMIAAMGEDPTLRKVPCGFFPPDSPMASDAGMTNIPPKPEYERAKRALYEADYKGERVVLMATTDFPTMVTASEVFADMLRRVGMNVDYQAMDNGTLIQRRVINKPLAEGGWSCTCGFLGCFDFFTPATHFLLRGNGEKGVFGWASSPRIEELRDQWLDAPDLEARKKIAAEIQAQAFIDVPYLPLGMYYNPSVYRRDVTDILHGFPIFWNMRRA